MFLYVAKFTLFPVQLTKQGNERLPIPLFARVISHLIAVLNQQIINLGY
ncbi:hypothetical protein AERO8C_160079 [Aeromonas veronii]|jgi:hypothetical protein|uniref:Uncharacterized protein n=1 Tax=Aeromonas veronii TaxID=654 RepID=A0A653KYX2_AERVE|nr:hypothetical protein AERO8C_160079 [Aeromonas veronii]